jgi:nitrogen fixation-related uncharacterized protein
MAVAVRVVAIFWGVANEKQFASEFDRNRRRRG